ncbi:sugar ABC transporter ATP-binding protein [Streptomyces sp. NPDC055105]|uniref:sugar ABC transporter ATP-binding protein n=1 Tax=Streptomyces sp. NPDC055105 TaxID=3365719 RepID=UPI0037CED71E
MTAAFAVADHLHTGPPLVELCGVSKSYGGVHALVSVDLTIARPGQIVGLIGENGSGKSTTLCVLSGQVRPDSGTVRVQGEERSFTSAVDALAAGIAMVSQETAVAEGLSIGENILMGHLVRRHGGRGIDWAASHWRAAEMLDRLGVQFDTHQLVGTLRADQKQLVEIARALSSDARVLILDEPTSSLTDDQVEGLFAAVRTVAANGVAVVFVSHRMPELFALTDSIVVLRDGRVTLTATTAETSPDEIVDAMVGRATELLERAPRTPLDPSAPPVLEVLGLSAPGAFEGVDLVVRQGEVVGLAGLAGAGRGELLESIFGLCPSSAGSVSVRGRSYANRSPHASIDHGVGYLPPERRTQGVVLSMSVGANLVMVSSRNRARLARPDRPSEVRAAGEAVQVMRLKTGSVDAPVGSLSGGNQQKIALAKWMAVSPAVLLLDEPTRGVDVAAKAEIHSRLRSSADDGLALLISSSEPEELLGICDRIVVLYRGRIVADLPADQITVEQLARYAGGHR